MSTSLVFREHTPLTLENKTAVAVQDAVNSLASVLKPRFTQVTRDGSTVEVRNLVGTVGLGREQTIQVLPKVITGDSWMDAVVQLLTTNSRLAVTGSRRSHQGSSHHDLTAMIAFEFERRLSTALRSDGPIEVFERRSQTSRRVNGQLDLRTYTRNLWRDPTLFPITREDLVFENDFTRGLSVAAQVLGRSVPGTDLAKRLRKLETALAPGMLPPRFVDPSICTRTLPVQWAAYKPAWDLATAILRNKSVTNRPGRSVGLEVAVEPWPLLETLLERVLHSISMDPDNGFRVRIKRSYPLLKHRGTTVGTLVPDGVLENPDGSVAATFEAKYTRPREHPLDSHRYQALSAAAVLHSPVSVIIYPGRQDSEVYEVAGFNNQPTKLITMGLDLFGYSGLNGDRSRALQVLDVLKQVHPLNRQ